MLEKRDFYINGKWVAPIEGKDHNVIDPSTEEPCAVISLGGKADADAAVAAAKAALPGWMATPAEERIALVEKLVEVYKARADDLAAAMSTEMGAPISMSKASQVRVARGTCPTLSRLPKSSTSSARWAITRRTTASSMKRLALRR